MTIEDFLNSSPEDIKNAVSNVEKVNDLANKIIELTGELKDLEANLENNNKEIQAWINDFNNGVTGNLVERAENLKKIHRETVDAIKTKREQLEEKEKEYDEIKNRKIKTSLATKIKNTFNKIKINKEEGLKLPKKEAKKVAEKGNIIVIKAKEKFQKFAQWAKEDLKQGVVYNTVESVKEKAPEITENVKEKVQNVRIKVDKVRSSIAKAPKKAFAGIKNAFSKMEHVVNNTRKVVVAKSVRFRKFVKDSVSNEVDYLKTANEINKEKREQLEAYKKQLEEEARLRKESAKNDIKTGRSL